MYYDFQLNENGDILFKQSDRSDSFLQFDFFVAKTNGLVFDFYVDTYEQREYLQDLKPGFVFEFCIDNPDKDKEIELQKQCIAESYEEKGFIHLGIPIFYVFFPSMLRDIENEEAISCKRLSAEEYLEKLYTKYTPEYY